MEKEKCQFNHDLITVKDTIIHTITAGSVSNPAIFFIHGWPACWREYEAVMRILSNQYYVIAIDLPGIGDSKTPLKSYRKRNIAEYVRRVMDAMNLSENITLVGCDIGVWIVYAFLKMYPERISRAVIMSADVPGLNPLEQYKKYVWHLSFNSIPELPEILVTGNIPEFFSYFYDKFKSTMSDEIKNAYFEAYIRPSALKAGFDIYRYIPEDEKDNITLKNRPVIIPVLYLRGKYEVDELYSNYGTKAESFVNGLKEHGLTNVKMEIIDDCGHFIPEDKPEEVSIVLNNFINGVSDFG